MSHESLQAEGFELSIPMPGHPVSEELQGKVLADVAKLADLIQHADLIFLLTDTRESRWLPTLLCACKSKVSAAGPLVGHALSHSCARSPA